MTAATLLASGEWAALVANIRGRPKDDTPRLVAADWLEERGAAELAEFVRVQCEVARWAFDPPDEGLNVRCRCRGCRLRRRERKLLDGSVSGLLADTSGLRWDVLVPPGGGRLNPDYRGRVGLFVRGLLGRVVTHTRPEVVVGDRHRPAADGFGVGQGDRRQVHRHRTDLRRGSQWEQRKRCHATECTAPEV